MPSGLKPIVFPVVSSLEKDWEALKKKCGVQNEDDFLNTVTMPDCCLSNIQIGVCTACNYNCPMCFNHYDTYYKYYSNTWISLEDFKRFILKNAPINDLAFSVSGEPFLHPDIFDMLEFARPHVKTFTFSTNGALLTEAKIEQLNTYPVNKIYLSIDGCDKHHYETFRKNGDFENIKQVIQNLTRVFGEKIVAACTVFRENKDNLLKMPEFLFEQGVKHMVLFRFFEHPASGEKGIHRLNAQETESFMCDLLSANKRFNITIGWDTRIVNQAIAKGISKKTGGEFASDPSVFRHHCTIPFHNILVDGEGNYNFCCAIEPIPADSLETPVRELFNTREIKIMRVMNLLRKYPSMCKKYCGKINDDSVPVSLESLQKEISKEKLESLAWHEVETVRPGSKTLLVPSGGMTKILLDNGFRKHVDVTAVIDRNSKDLNPFDERIPLLEYEAVSALDYDTVVITSGAFWREIFFWFYENDPQWNQKDFYRIEITQKQFLCLENNPNSLISL